MEWRTITYCAGFSISAAKLPSGCWKATVEALGVSRAVDTAGPGEGAALPGEFDSEEAAVDAAKIYINDRLMERYRQT